MDPDLGAVRRRLPHPVLDRLLVLPVHGERGDGADVLEDRARGETVLDLPVEGLVVEAQEGDGGGQLVDDVARLLPRVEDAVPRPQPRLQLHSPRVLHAPGLQLEVLNAVLGEVADEDALLPGVGLRHGAVRVGPPLAVLPVLEPVGVVHVHVLAPRLRVGVADLAHGARVVERQRAHLGVPVVDGHELRGLLRDVYVARRLAPGLDPAAEGDARVGRGVDVEGEDLARLVDALGGAVDAGEVGVLDQEGGVGRHREAPALRQRARSGVEVEGVDPLAVAALGRVRELLGVGVGRDQDQLGGLVELDLGAGRGVHAIGRVHHRGSGGVGAVVGVER
mmetsp:Transcript_63196/g.155496  ORF Transcript_63196/g.155496 Transcript_63196/m.155496 type:complete len:336 (-) Transcript_63196:12-1019(-)